MHYEIQILIIEANFDILYLRQELYLLLLNFFYFITHSKYNKNRYCNLKI